MMYEGIETERRGKKEGEKRKGSGSEYKGREKESIGSGRDVPLQW